MFKKILCTKVQHMPTTEELALYGIYEDRDAKRLVKVRMNCIRTLATKEPTIM